MTPEETKLRYDESNDESSPLDEKKRNSVSKGKVLTKCPLCLEEKVEDLLYRLQQCKHASCSTCLSDYLRAHLRDQSKYPLKCYLPECQITILKDDIQFLLKPEEVLVYERFLLRVNLESDEKRQPLYCPLPGCKTMMIVSLDDLTVPLKVCTGCNREFCCQCVTKWHEGKTCDEAKLADGGKTEETRKVNLALLQETAKKEKWISCPKCGFFIERTGGCHHMSHLRSQGCKTVEEATHFCSLCSMILGGKYHKDEPSGVLHFPEGLFKACRVSAKLIAEGKMAPLPPPQPGDGHEDPLQQAPVGQPQVDLGRTWISSLLCGCLSSPSNCWTCMKGCCCPCYLAGETEEMLPMLSENSSKWRACWKYCCCWICVAPLKRYRLRRLFDIRGFCCFDCCASYLCPCCSVIQERSELLRRAGPDVQVMA